MSDNKMFSGDIDPEIAELMGIEATSVSSEPDFNDLFSEGTPQQQPREEVNLTRDKFEHIVKIEENAKPFFADKNYYKNLLNDGSEAGKRLHTLLSSFMSTQDPKDRSIYRGKMIAAYWNFIERIAREAHTNLPVPKQLVLRFGLLHPGILSQEQRTMISKVIMPNTSGEPVHYVDEWLQKVITGQVNPSATDETKAVKIHVNKKVHSQLEKYPRPADLSQRQCPHQGLGNGNPGSRNQIED